MSAHDCSRCVATCRYTDRRTCVDAMDDVGRCDCGHPLDGPEPWCAGAEVVVGGCGWGEARDEQVAS